MLAQQMPPMGFMPTLGLGEGEEYLPLLTAAAPRQVPVDRGLGLLISQVLAPPPDVGRTRA